MSLDWIDKRLQAEEAVKDNDLGAVAQALIYVGDCIRTNGSIIGEDLGTTLVQAGDIIAEPLKDIALSLDTIARSKHG